ncbi:hypothetical protein DERF_011003 [Dermatophagoides farinae]|uniref:Uncharacterized protein n=1 Tax=Dermatophagoides farinae TaxID=6954 RepID=A0A922L2P5_DERFA|nr:hypothetical protein DERF_011003 [Dermatophagoides farinae]
MASITWLFLAVVILPPSPEAISKVSFKNSAVFAGFGVDGLDVILGLLLVTGGTELVENCN